jgi:hypothetical protein
MADVFGAVTDSALNWIVDFAHARAPFLFNYVAPSLRILTDANGNPTGTQDLWLVCAPVPDSPLGPNMPKYRRMSPFGVPGFPVKLPYSIQIVDATIDFYPGDQVTLPAELLPPLNAQAMALKISLLFGFPCTNTDLVSAIIQHQTAAMLFAPIRWPVLPVTDLLCFTVDVFATGRLAVQSTPTGAPYPLQNIRLIVDGLELVDIAPKGLEGAIECYLTAMLRNYVLPQLVLGLQNLVISTLGMTLTPHLTLNLPNNPAIEQNELRVWLDVDVT